MYVGIFGVSMEKKKPKHQSFLQCSGGWLEPTVIFHKFLPSSPQKSTAQKIRKCCVLFFVRENMMGLLSYFVKNNIGNKLSWYSCQYLRNVQFLFSLPNFFHSFYFRGKQRKAGGWDHSTRGVSELPLGVTALLCGAGAWIWATYMVRNMPYQVSYLLIPN